MSGLSGRLRSGGVRVVCGGVAEEECVEPEAWGAGGGATGAGGSIGPAPSASALHYSVYPSHTLANGLRSHDNQRHVCRRRNEETANANAQQDRSDRRAYTHLESDTATPLQQVETHTAQPLMHTESQTPSYTQGDTHPEMELESSTVQPQTHRQTPSPLLKPMAPAHTSPPTTPLPPDHTKPNHTTTTCNTGHVPISSPAELERKYTLRSSGRPRFPSHLRKSSRLRRVSESTKDRQEDEMEEEERQVKREEKNWRGGEIERVKTERTPEISSPTAPPPPPPPPPPPAPPCNPHPPPLSTPPTRTSSCPMGCPPHIKRKGRFRGARRIVVKVPRIPVHLSRRQKSYKISSLEAVSWVGGSKEANMGVGSQRKEGEGPPREPTALLRMKNNGKSVMVMFPPGELPVILKRRRGRPPKQALPGQPDLKETRAAAAAIAAAGGNADMPKKPRRRRRVKLPSPQPCYVTETNDTYTEYADVLSKLAFLTRQPPPTGRCSPPRCWTPTQPESASASLQNPALPALLQRLSGFRRRGGRGGGAGLRGGGGAAGMGGSSPKSSFCDFFETIGKKRKALPSEPGAPRKRGKGGGLGGAGGMNRASLSEKKQAGEVDPMAPPGEKPPRKRRSRKNGQLKAGQGLASDDWANGSMAWEGKNTPERETGGRYGSLSCTEGRGSGGMYGSPGVQSSGGDEAQGLFAGYFRSLLDSDDSSDLLDMSSPPARKPPVGFEGSPQRWSPAFPKCSPKGQSTPVDGGLPQTKSSSSTPVRPSYPYGQISPTTPSYSKSSTLSQSRSPSSPHPSTGYAPFPSGYTSSTGTHPHIPAGAVSSPSHTQQRASDCSFGFGAKASSSPSTQCQMGYANYQPAAKCSYGAYSPGHSALMRGEGNGPTSPGGGYMMMSKSSHHASSSGSMPEEYRQFAGQWGYRQAWGGSEGFVGSQYHSYAEYTGATTSPESKDILDISNYTPQKTKQRACSDTLSESSSDSSHISGGGRGAYRQREVPVVEGQSSLSSLEKLMMDWNESSTGPSYNWSQSMLFQGGSKPGRGRRKQSESPQGEKEACPSVTVPPGSPVSPSSHSSGSKRVGVGGRGSRGSRGGRYGYSPCQRERSTTKSKLPSQKSPTRSMFQETLDYYSGDSSSLSPLSHGPETCEYPSPYSGHSSTASSDERASQIYPTDSTSLSPSPSVQLDVLKPYPKPAQAPPSQPYCSSSSSRTFSPTLSPTPRLLPQCGSSASKEQISQYDSPRYSSSPCWYNPHAYEDPRNASKRDLPMMSPGLRAMPPSPYPGPVQRAPPHTGACDPEEYMRGGVLCQLLDQSSEDCFTSL
ncbi:AT-hook DNA-binding motif-containing protein 1 [Alosa sapidissima]|uniref:AT-hook DNA-binding motif-containing protein 1 n=1 Tax=Alosa sapidissima TaxID=34773 RepID=UPI001C0908F5|nr:AT-hook DNA-binding motif-containing protein 1 [Alosa sapidissima]